MELKNLSIGIYNTIKLHFKKKTILFFSILFIFSSCATEKFFAPTPNYNSEQTKYIPKASYMSMPINVSMQTLNTSMNKMLKGLIYEDATYENNGNDNLKVRVWRNKADIKISGEKNKIKFYIPLQIWADYQVAPCDICPKTNQSTNFDMDIDLYTTLQITPNWEAVPTTIIKEFIFQTSPKLDFGFVQIPITPIVKKALQANATTITSAIDQEVTKSVGLKTTMSKIWKDLQEPLLMDSTYKTWLTLNPVEIYLTPIKVDDKNLHIEAGILSFIDTKIGDKPIILKKNEIAPPVSKDKLDSKFDLELPVEIDFKMATELANRQFKDSTFVVSKKKKIIVNDILIYGKGGDVFIKTDLSGSFKGVIYFRGKPTLDTLTNTIYFQDLDFDIDTKNALYKAAAWLLHGTVKNIMKKKCVYNITEDLVGAQKAIQNYLGGYTYKDLLKVNGNINQLKLKNIYTNEEGIKAIFMANGKIGFDILSLGVK